MQDPFFVWAPFPAISYSHAYGRANAGAVAAIGGAIGGAIGLKVVFCTFDENENET